MTARVMTGRLALPAPAVTDRGYPAEAWVRRLLDLDLTPLLGRAAWRPQALALVVARSSVTPWPTVEQVAADLAWKPSLAARHAALCVAAGLLVLLPDPAPGARAPGAAQTPRSSALLGDDARAAGEAAAMVEALARRPLRTRPLVLLPDPAGSAGPRTPRSGAATESPEREHTSPPDAPEQPEGT